MNQLIENFEFNNEIPESSITTEPLENEQRQNPDIEIMCHIREILEGGFPEEKKGDPSFKIVYKQVIEYISRNCCHRFINDWIDMDPETGGNSVEYCDLCLTTKK